MPIAVAFFLGVAAGLRTFLVSPSVGAEAGAQTACAVKIFPRYGTYAFSGMLHGPGLVLDGGGALEAPKSSLVWMHDTLVGAHVSRRAGNVVVLRAADANIYDAPFYRDGNFASVQTVLVPPCATRAQVDAVAPVIDRADAVFWAGGDQANYVAWKGTALASAVKRLYARGGVIGGGSAGLAIQGAVVYDSVAADRLGTVTKTSDAVRDPLEPRISFTTGFFTWPALANTLTDTHFAVRDRFGRSVAFAARMLYDGTIPGAKTVYVLGIDQASSVVVAPDGIATVLDGPGGTGAYLIRASAPVTLQQGRPLYYAVDVSHVAAEGARFDLLHKTTLAPWYRIRVDGMKPPFYSRNPYRL